MKIIQASKVKNQDWNYFQEKTTLKNEINSLKNEIELLKSALEFKEEEKQHYSHYS